MLARMSPEAASKATGVEFVEATFEQWSPCPVCGGPTHHELLIGSEEVVCDDTACSWDGVVIDTVDD